MRYADFPDIQPNAQRTADNVPVDVRILSRPFAGVPENNRGQSVLLEPVTHDNFLPVIETKHGGEDAEMMTIALGYEIVNPLSGGDHFNLFDIKAQIQWGIGGTTQEAIVDVQRGTFIRIPAQTIRVAVNYKNPGGLPSQIRFSAQVGYGSQVARASNARFTQELDPIGAGPGTQSGAREAPIPAFASSLSVYLKVAGGVFVPGPIPAGVILTTGNAGNPSIHFNIPDLLTPTQENNIVIPNGYTFVRVDNQFGGPIRPVLVYTLTL